MLCRIRAMFTKKNTADDLIKTQREINKHPSTASVLYNKAYNIHDVTLGGLDGNTSNFPVHQGQIIRGQNMIWWIYNYSISSLLKLVLRLKKQLNKLSDFSQRAMVPNVYVISVCNFFLFEDVLIIFEFVFKIKKVHDLNFLN